MKRKTASVPKKKKDGWTCEIYEFNNYKNKTKYYLYKFLTTD